MIPQSLLKLHQLQAGWSRQFASPTWYLTIVPEIQTWIEQLRKEPVEVQQQCKKELYDFFERQLVEETITLGHDSNWFDADRKPIDMIVIHHTSNPPGMTQDRLSAIELIRLYAPYFAHPTSKEDAHLRGQPIFSGHERRGKQVLWPYHWIIRTDGRAERLLDDRETGWHAGDWNVNCRSVAIALDNDYEWSRPSDVELRSVAKLISSRYSSVPWARVVGHREVNSKTACPSNLFLGGVGGGWKNDLAGYVIRQKHAA